MAEEKNAVAVNERAAAKAAREARGEGGGREKEGMKEAKLDDFIVAVHRMATLVADADVFSKNGVTIAEWSMLKAMGNKTEASLNEVSKRASVSRQRLRTLLADLEKKGFIKVARDDRDEGDKRTRAVTVLPKCTEVVSAIAREFDALAEKTPQLSKASGKRLAGAVRMAAKLGSVIQRTERGEAGAQEEGARRRADNPGRAAADTPERAAERARRREERGGGQTDRKAKN
jgi:DNA-binding MarR family transcriptional regulator